MKMLKTLLLYMCFVKVGICQSRYPVDAIDSLGNKIVIISDAQNKWILQQLGNYDLCSEISDSTESALKLSLSLNEEKNNVIRQYVGITAKQDSIIKQDKLLFTAHKKIIQDFELLDKAHLQQEKFLKSKVLGFQIGTGLAVSAGIALLLFLK
jgi:hypothetical protein